MRGQVPSAPCSTPATIDKAGLAVDEGPRSWAASRLAGSVLRLQAGSGAAVAGGRKAGRGGMRQRIAIAFAGTVFGSLRPGNGGGLRLRSQAVMLIDVLGRLAFPVVEIVRMRTMPWKRSKRQR